jgi:hypothetical protein
MIENGRRQGHLSGDTCEGCLVMRRYGSPDMDILAGVRPGEDEFHASPAQQIFLAQEAKDVDHLFVQKGLFRPLGLFAAGIAVEGALANAIRERSDFEQLIVGQVFNRLVQ